MISENYIKIKIPLLKTYDLIVIGGKEGKRRR